MILLDSSVVSQAMKPQPHPAVRDWLDAQAAETRFPCSVTITEIMFGIGALPKGRRKERLAAAFDGLLVLFDPRILLFDAEAAHQFAVASRDTSAFVAAAPTVIDPSCVQD